jgi:hypothetical protein
MFGEDAANVEVGNLKRMDHRLDLLDEMNKRRKTNFTYFEVWPPSTNAPTNNAPVDETSPPPPPRHPDPPPLPPKD